MRDRDWHTHTAMMRSKKKASVNIDRRKYLSKRVSIGMELILKRIKPETEEEWKAVEWIRDLLDDRLSRLLAQDAPSPQHSEGGESKSLSSLEEEAR